MKAKDDELKITVKKIKVFYRSISDFKKSYQPRTNIVKYEKVDIFADFHSILVRWNNNFSRLLNVHGVNGVK
jgi:hypothetical protein